MCVCACVCASVYVCASKSCVNENVHKIVHICVQLAEWGTLACV